jgi:beta-glucosidase
MSINWAQRHVPAVLEAWYSGEEGGDAIADVILGDYNPAGRLPVTFYRGVDQLPDFRTYSMANRTYRYFKGEPLYPFGYGLSYTRFAYDDMQAPRRLAPGSQATVTVRVRNVGDRAGDEVVQVYLRPSPDAAVREIAPDLDMPRLFLAGFQRISLSPGESRTVSFALGPQQLQLVNEQGMRSLQPGEWQVFVGGGQPSLSGEAYDGNGLSSRLVVR